MFFWRPAMYFLKIIVKRHNFTDWNELELVGGHSIIFNHQVRRMDCCQIKLLVNEANRQGFGICQPELVMY